MNGLEFTHGIDSNVKETARAIKGVPLSPDPNAKAAKERTQRCFIHLHARPNPISDCVTKQEWMSLNVCHSSYNSAVDRQS